MWCCEPTCSSEKEHSKAVDIVSSEFSNLMRMIRDEIDDPKEQEGMVMQLFKVMWNFSDIAKLAEKLLDIKKKLKLKEIEEEKVDMTEDKQESESIMVMFEGLSDKETE